MGAATVADKVQDSEKDAHFLQRELIEELLFQNISGCLPTSVSNITVIVNYR